MNLHLRPILSTMLRNWGGPALVAAQIAVTLAVTLNAVYVVKSRADKIARPTGMDVGNIFVINSSGVVDTFAPEPAIREDLAYLRSLSSVIAVTPTNATPLSDEGGRIGVMLKPDDQAHGIRTNYYEVDEQGLDALGLHLTAGRAFRFEDVLPPRAPSGSFVPVHEAIITQSLANALYPAGDALGKPIYDVFGRLSSPASIIGIVERMQGSRLNSDSVDRVLLVPRLPLPEHPGALYMVRTTPGQRDAVMRAVEAHLQDSNPDRMIEWVRPLEFFKDRSYGADRNMEIFLSAVILMLLAVTCIGIYGLAKFNVSVRTRQIGIRRAIGAGRLEIVSYFLVENWLISTAGVAIGVILCLAVGGWMSRHYAVPRLDLRYFALGIPAVWIIGLVAAWLPARNAAAISPAVATRAV